MKKRIPDIALRNGVKLPAIGLGTWLLTSNECIATVKTALKLGYTHIDTAERYGNEAEIGIAINDVKRDSVFVTSKVYYDDLHHNDVIASCDRSLAALNTDYIDLYLIHWPNKEVPMKETFSALQELHEQGKIRAIGVSNFSIRHLKEALKVSKLPICVNQIECSLGWHDDELLSFCKKHKIEVVAYSPLGHGTLLENPAVQEIAYKHGKSPAQVALRWLTQQGYVVIPKATREDLLKENLAVFDFDLDDVEMKSLSQLPQHKFVNPPQAEWD